MFSLVRHLGPQCVWRRASEAFHRRTGLRRRRFPTPALAQLRLADQLGEHVPSDPAAYQEFRQRSDARFFFPLGRCPDGATLQQVVGPAGRQHILAVADDYGRGRCLYYSRQVFDLGWPPNGLLSPVAGAAHHARVHWCDYPTFSTTAGDIKDVWEPSRFACAFWLVRAYALTGSEQYAQTFWTWFESWCRQNPPNMGPNWKCGQETALRSLAWCFALHGFWHASPTTAPRVAALVTMLAFQADRIADNIAFAVSLKNNHALSEAVGLLTTAWLFPELKGATRWERIGRRVLEKEVRRQIYDDGSYVQHSMNYHRVMLDDCLWAIRLGELNGQPLSTQLRTRVGRAADFLFQMLDTPSGHVPNYGANDGAWLLPLSACDYTDYRPVIQATGYQSTGQRVLGDGPWNETLLWLFGSETLGGPAALATPTSRRFDAGGYYTLRTPDAWCLVRCHRYRDRPVHVDPLHLDFWYQGVNLLGDSGTYRYYVPENPALERYFKDLGAHNTIELDGRGPLELVARFLWLPWPRALCREHTPQRWCGEHYAYRRAPWRVTHRRTLTLVDDRTWVIQDDLLGGGEHAITLRWHLVDAPYRLDVERRALEIEPPCGPVTLQIEGPAELALTVHRGVQTPELVSGWRSDYYGECIPRPTLEIAGRFNLPVRLLTRIHLGRNTTL
jgi:hypothetical protein